MNLSLDTKQSELILQTIVAQNVDLFVPPISGHLQLFKSKTSILGRLMCKYMSLIVRQPMHQSAKQSCPTSNLINININFKHPYSQATTNTPRLLPPKLFKITVLSQIVNIPVLFFILVEIIIGAPIFYIRINVSLFLLENIKLNGSFLLIYQVISIIHQLYTLLCINIIAGAIIIQHINTNKSLFQMKIIRLSANQFGVMRGKMR